MENHLAQECEQSFYKVLYHLHRPEQAIVIDETTEQVWLQKSCRIYNLEVYRYLQVHPDLHIPLIHALWEDDAKEELTVIEQWIQGETLEALLERGTLSHEERENIALQLCDALLFLHGSIPPIIHRDIKAENVMIERNGNVILLDYNAAKLYHENETRDTILIGTEGAAAPEQYGFRQSDARTDIYGLGILLRRMFPEDPKMQKIAAKATQLDPERRYQNAAQLRDALTRRSGSSGFTLPIPGFRSGKPWMMAAASLGFLTIVLLSLTLNTVNTTSAAVLWANRLIFFLLCLSAVDLFADWTHFFRHFPFMRSRNPALRILGYTIALILIFFFWMLLLSILEILLAG